MFAKCTQVHDLAIKFCSAVSPKSSQEIFFVFLFFKELNNCSTFSLKKKSIRKLICNFFLLKSSGTSAKIYEWKFYSAQMCKVPVLYYLQQLKYVEGLFNNFINWQNKKKISLYIYIWIFDFPGSIECGLWVAPEIMVNRTITAVLVTLVVIKIWFIRLNMNLQRSISCSDYDWFNQSALL